MAESHRVIHIDIKFSLSIKYHMICLERLKSNRKTLCIFLSKLSRAPCQIRRHIRREFGKLLLGRNTSFELTHNRRKELRRRVFVKGIRKQGYCKSKRNRDTWRNLGVFSFQSLIKCDSGYFPPKKIISLINYAI